MLQSAKSDLGVAYIVDDDPAIAALVTAILQHAGIECAHYSDGQSFLDAVDPAARGCLLLDVQMPGLTGPQVQKELFARQIMLPIVFLTASDNLDTAIAALKDGAIDYLRKPFDPAGVVTCVREAIARDAKAARLRRVRETVLQNERSLSPRERDVLWLVVEGLPNKNIARQLGVSERTVEVHRSRVMEKMQVDNLPDLVRYAQVVREWKR